MKIACLGWGSLIWDPQNLKVQRKWFQDGPILPIEFTRLSKDGRMTLVIDDSKNTRPVRVLWTLMTVNNLTEARESLQKREGTLLIEKIPYITTNGDTGGASTVNATLTIQSWLQTKDIDAVIWTGLDWSSKKNKEGDEKGEFGGKRPNKKQVVEYLDKLKDKKQHSDAEKYIRKAPKQIDTVYRRAIEKKFGWIYVCG